MRTLLKFQVKTLFLRINLAEKLLLSVSKVRNQVILAIIRILFSPGQEAAKKAGSRESVKKWSKTTNSSVRSVKLKGNHNNWVKSRINSECSNTTCINTPVTRIILMLNSVSLEMIQPPALLYQMTRDCRRALPALEVKHTRALHVARTLILVKIPIIVE